MRQLLMAAQQRYGLPVVGVSLGQNLIHSLWLIKNGHFWCGLSQGDVVGQSCAAMVGAFS